MIGDTDFGPVRVIAGKHKGKVGYFDNTEMGTDKAIVYFGTPFESDDALIRLRHLEKFKGKFAPLEAWKRKHPVITVMLRVP